MNKDLIRYPKHLQGKNLFAWSSADELLVDHVLKMSDIEKMNILIINDQFGALSANLGHLNIHTYTDSFLSAKSIEINTKGKIEAINSLDELKGNYDLVLVYLPKNHSFFEDTLAHLASSVERGTQVIFTGMVKHISKGHFELIEKYAGELSTSLAVKKARLIFSNLNKGVQKSPYPKEVMIPGFEHSFTHHSNIFSREKLDIGTRFFLENLPEISSGNVLDLGCANGIIGIKTKLKKRNVKLYFSDESKMAIESARTNYSKYQFDDEADFFWTHNTEGLEDIEFDYILCNPPFHQGNTVGVHIAIDMFKSSFQKLKPGGVLRIIANSHLGYHSQLKKIFGNYKLINSSKKFVVYDSVK